MSVFVEERQRKETLATALVEARLRSRGWDLLAWTSVHRRMLKIGVPFDLTRHAYMRAIYENQARRLVVYKASQLGASEYALSYALHAADARGGTGLYILPTDAIVSDFSAARLWPAMEASPYLEGIVIEGGAAEVDGHKMRGADRVTLKRVRDRFIYLRGGQVKPDGGAHPVKTIDADGVVLDEGDAGRPVKWNKDARGRAIAACQKCGKKLNRLGPGEWVPQMPGRDTAGFHLTKLFSPTARLAGLVENLHTTKENKRGA